MTNAALKDAILAYAVNGGDEVIKSIKPKYGVILNKLTTDKINNKKTEWNLKVENETYEKKIVNPIQLLDGGLFDENVFAEGNEEEGEEDEMQ